MSDDSGMTSHARGVVVTTIACLAGVAAGVVSAAYVGVSPTDATSTMAVVIMAVFVFVQFPIMKIFGVAIEDFGIKDNLYVTFMTFTLWFITYAIVLTEEVTL